MKPVRRAALITLAAVVAAALWLTFKSYTDPIFAPHAVARLERVDVDGDAQSLLIRGRDRDAPVLLFLHGGPGMPAMYLAHAFQRPLEEDFVVVQWDQRGAGKSYRDDVDPAEMKISRLLADAEIVIEHLRDEFGVDDVYVVGHSHGSYLGALLTRERPDLVRAFVGVGQVVDSQRSRALQDAFFEERRAELGVAEDVSWSEAGRENLLFASGSEIYGETSFLPLVLTGVMAPEYSLFDVLHVQPGSAFASEHMAYDVIGGSLWDEVAAFDAPYYLIQGRRDMVTPTALALDYFDRVSAPRKDSFVIDAASHFPFFERPDAFAAAMRAIKAEVEGGAP
jgi:pimeloyl-ACP methyl ester carboxylesterase